MSAAGIEKFCQHPPSQSKRVPTKPTTTPLTNACSTTIDARNSHLRENKDRETVRHELLFTELQEE